MPEDSIKRYENAVAAERVAFQAMLDSRSDSPDYCALVQRWRDAMADSDAARTAMFDGFRSIRQVDAESKE